MVGHTAGQSQWLVEDGRRIVVAPSGAESTGRQVVLRAGEGCLESFSSEGLMFSGLGCSVFFLSRVQQGLISVLRTQSL